MKKRYMISTVLPIAFLAISLTTLIPPLVQAIETHGHYTVGDYGAYAAAVRCDHTLDPPGPGAWNAFTACGIQAFYDGEGDAFDEIHYTYYRGFGGPDMYPYYWWCYGLSMTMMYQRDSTQTYQYSSSQPTYYSSGQEWPGYYHIGGIVAYPYQHAEKVGARASSYFKATWYPYPQIYIASYIPADDMQADNITPINEEF